MSGNNLKLKENTDFINPLLEIGVVETKMPHSDDYMNFWKKVNLFVQENTK